MGIKNREMTGVTEIRELLDDGGFVRMNIVDGFTSGRGGWRPFIHLSLCVCECLLLISFQLFHVGRCWGEAERVDVDGKNSHVSCFGGVGLASQSYGVAWAWQVRVTGMSFGKAQATPRSVM